MKWVSNRLKLWKQHRAEQRQRATERIAHTLYQRRVRLNRHGDQSSDWATAERIVRSSLRQALFSINGSLINTEKRIVEPLNQHLKNSALFDIVDRLSPALEAIGVLLIPLVLYLATQAYEQQREAQANERLQQESVQNYINQLSEILLNVEGDLRSPENQRIRTVTTAATFTLLNDPILNGERKGQVIGFLSQMELVQGSFANNGNFEFDPIISLAGVDLSYAKLAKGNLYPRNLRPPIIILDREGGMIPARPGGSHLSGADLSYANLSSADLRAVNIDNANLRNANLNRANLNRANLSEASLFGASLESATLVAANLKGANLSQANLSNVNLSGAEGCTDKQLETSILCNSILPQGSKLDPDRNCPK